MRVISAAAVRCGCDLSWWLFLCRVNGPIITLLYTKHNVWEVQLGVVNNFWRFFVPRGYCNLVWWYETFQFNKLHTLSGAQVFLRFDVNRYKSDVMASFGIDRSERHLLSHPACRFLIVCNVSNFVLTFQLHKCDFCHFYARKGIEMSYRTIYNGNPMTSFYWSVSQSRRQGFHIYFDKEHSHFISTD
jgi:hypothetical protein